MYTYQDCYVKQKNPVPEQRYLDIKHMKKHSEYFGEALDMCERFGLLPIMQVQCDYEKLMIAQFYATVHLGSDDARTLKWMTRDRVMTSTWGRFAQLLGYSY